MFGLSRLKVMIEIRKMGKLEKEHVEAEVSPGRPTRFLRHRVHPCTGDTESGDYWLRVLLMGSRLAW